MRGADARSRIREFSDHETRGPVEIERRDSAVLFQDLKRRGQLLPVFLRHDQERQLREPHALQPDRIGKLLVLRSPFFKLMNISEDLSGNCRSIERLNRAAPREKGKDLLPDSFKEGADAALSAGDRLAESS